MVLAVYRSTVVVVLVIVRVRLRLVNQDDAASMVWWVMPCVSSRAVSNDTSTPTIVARLQEHLTALTARSRSIAPTLSAGLVEAQELITEMVARWRRSTTLALDSIKSFEDQLAKKNEDIDRLQKQVLQLVGVCCGCHAGVPCRCVIRTCDWLSRRSAYAGGLGTALCVGDRKHGWRHRQ